MRGFATHLTMIVLLTLWSLSTASAQPKWATQPPAASSLYLYGVGIAHATKDAAGDRQRADDAARADLVRQLRVTITSRLTTITTETSTQGVTYDTRQIVESSVSFTLEGTEIKERVYDKKHKTYYALARLNRQAASERLAGTIGSAALRAAAVMKQAERRRAEGSAYRMFLTLLQAAEERATVNMEENLYRALGAGAVDALLDSDGASASSFAPTLTAIEKEIGAIVNGLSFADITGARQTLSRGHVPAPASARLVIGADQNAAPASGFPIQRRITEGLGALDRQTESGPNGETVVSIQRLVPGGALYGEVTMMVDTSVVRSQAPAGQIDRWITRLGQAQTRFTFLPGEYGFEDGVMELAGRLVRSLPEKTVLVVGRFTYQDTRIAGPFTGPLRQQLRTELAAAGRRLIESPVFSAQTAEYGQPDAVETIARSAKADAVIWGEYWEKGDSVVVQARATGSDGIRLASAQIVIPRDAIAHTIRPSALDVDLPEAPANGLPVHLWTDRSDGAIYAGGERLQVYVQTETDGYLRLLYRQVDGQVIQIFPNRLSGDERVSAHQVYTAPDAGAPYQFVIQPPFGVEYLIAIASAAPFPQLSGQEINGGILLQGTVREAIKRLTMGKTWYGQAIYRLTTVQP